jgi:lysozyme
MISLLGLNNKDEQSDAERIKTENDATPQKEIEQSTKITILTDINSEIQMMAMYLQDMIDKKRDEKQDAEAQRKEDARKVTEDGEEEQGENPFKAIEKFFKWMSSLLQSLIFSLIIGIQTFVNPIKGFLEKIKEETPKKIEQFKIWIGDAIEKIAQWWQESIITPMLDFFMETIPNKFKKITTFFGDALQSIAWAMGDIGDGIVKWVFETANNVLKKMVSLTSGIKIIGPMVQDALAPAIEALDRKISDKQTSMDARDQARADRDKLRAEEAAQYDEEVKQKRKEEKESGKVDKSARVPTEGARDDKDKSESKPATKISGMQDVKNMIKRHEGVRYKAYKDSLGLWTIGVGHLIGDGKSQGPYEGKTLTEGEVDALFEEDFAHHYAIAQGTPGWQLANETGKGAMIDLAFNMGKWWTKWPKTSKLLGEGEFESAADEMLDSKWAKQVKGRAITVTDMIRVGGANGSEIDMESMAAKIEVKPQTNKSMTGNQTQIASSQSPIKTPGKKSGGSSKVNAVSLQETYHSRLIQQGNA